MSDIVVVGSLNMDLVARVARMPHAGETVSGHEFQTIPGGKGANQAAAAARLGGHVAMAGRVGNDAFGPVLIDNLGRQGVDTSHIAVDDGAPTGVALILVDESGQNSIVVAPGANGRVGRQDIDRLDDLLARARYLLLQFEIPLEMVQYALDRARDHHVEVILNPAPAQDLPAGVLSRVEYFVPNETEAGTLSGVNVTNRASAERAAKTLLGQGMPVVILTLGENGALVATRDGVDHVPARKVRAVDTTAAGDAFIGGLAVALVRGLALPEAVRYATCAGTLATTRFGAQTSLPSADQVQAFYESGEFALA